MKKISLILIIITIFTKIFGLLRDMVLSYFYGASSISDAYLVSLTIPFVIFAFIGTSITTGFIPIFSKIESEEGQLKSDIFASNIINIFLVCCICLVIFGVIFAGEIVKIFAIGFKGKTLDLAIFFTRISLLSILFSITVHIFSGYLQYRDRFISVSIIAMSANIVIIISIILSKSISLIFLPLGIVISYLIQLILLVPFVKKSGFKYIPELNIKDKIIVEFFRNSLPIIIGASANQINTLIDKTLASRIAEGAISSLNYSSRIKEMIIGVFVITIVTTMFPQLTRLINNNRIKEAKKLIESSITTVTLLIIPSTFGLLIFATPIINALYGRGSFDNSALSMTSNTLFFYTFGLISFSYREILTRVFYSMRNTSIPMINAFIAMTLNIVLNIVLSKFMGVSGLALATSIAASLSSLMLFISLRKKIGPFGMRQISISFLKIFFASLIMGVLAKLSFNYLTTSLSQNLSLLLAISVGVISYLVIIYFMKIEDVDVIVEEIKKKLG